MILANSRYRRSKVVAFRKADGTIRKFLEPRFGLGPDDVEKGFVIHEYRVGQKLEDISRLYYGRSDLWWFIAEVNGMVNPLDIQPNARLAIPPSEVALAQTGI